MDKDDREEAKGLPEAITHKQKILKFYYDAISWLENYLLVSSHIKKTNFRQNPIGERDARAMKNISFDTFQYMIHGLYISLSVYKLKQKEIDFFQKLDDAVIKEQSMDFPYLYEALKVLGEIIRRLGITDFPIVPTPRDKTFLEE
ncbi:MAG: hypothetical protein HYT70_03680 [Candidatus Aenigmarchaeota archaeon]|nr:hypothetical protein [Candidatus Aenigmarchaeota archaeon]